MGRKILCIAALLVAAGGCAKSHTAATQTTDTTAPAASSAIETPVASTAGSDTSSISSDLNGVDSDLGQTDGQLSDANNGMTYNESGDVQ